MFAVVFGEICPKYNKATLTLSRSLALAEARAFLTCSPPCEFSQVRGGCSRETFDCSRENTFDELIAIFCFLAKVVY